MTKEELLAEIEDLMRTMPSTATLHHDLDENYAWLGRVAAVLGAWNSITGGMIKLSIDDVHSGDGGRSVAGIRNIRIVMNQARHDLRMQTVGPTNVAIGQGGVFDYFDEVRKVVEAATQDVYFVDPYLDAEFVAKYLGHVSAGVAIRLLTKEKLATLLPAVDTFSQQHKRPISVRLTPAIHDRYVFIDNSECYQSGASFKDGAKKAPTTLTQIVDAFPAMHKTYDDLWNGAGVVR